MALFDDFHKGNFGTTILLAKCSETCKVQQYRPTLVEK
jgi:hypothetical protein